MTPIMFPPGFVNDSTGSCDDDVEREQKLPWFFQILFADWFITWFALGLVLSPWVSVRVNMSAWMVLIVWNASSSPIPCGSNIPLTF